MTLISSVTVPILLLSTVVAETRRRIGDVVRFIRSDYDCGSVVAVAKVRLSHLVIRVIFLIILESIIYCLEASIGLHF